MVAEASETKESMLRAAYPELREMAARLIRRERKDHTLQRTALVHEVFVRLFQQPPDQIASVQDFLAIAARQMRQILIDYARKHASQKRGGGLVRVPLFEDNHSLIRDEDSLLALEEALQRLGDMDQRALSVVELKFFCGYTNGEAAEILGVSNGTIESNWQFARSWLFGALTDKRPPSRV